MRLRRELPRRCMSARDVNADILKPMKLETSSSAIIPPALDSTLTSAVQIQCNSERNVAISHAKRMLIERKSSSQQTFESKQESLEVEGNASQSTEAPQLLSQLERICVNLKESRPTWAKMVSQLERIFANLKKSRPTWAKMVSQLGRICVNLKESRPTWVKMAKPREPGCSPCQAARHAARHADQDAREGVSHCARVTWVTVRRDTWILKLESFDRMAASSLLRMLHFRLVLLLLLLIGGRRSSTSSLSLSSSRICRAKNEDIKGCRDRDIEFSVLDNERNQITRSQEKISINKKNQATIRAIQE